MPKNIGHHICFSFEGYECWNERIGTHLGVIFKSIWVLVQSDEISIMLTPVLNICITKLCLIVGTVCTEDFDH